MRIHQIAAVKEGGGCSEFRTCDLPKAWRGIIANEGSIAIHFATPYGLIASNSRLLSQDFQFPGEPKLKRKGCSARLWRPLASQSLVDEMRLYHRAMIYCKPDAVEFDCRLEGESLTLVLIPIGTLKAKTGAISAFRYHSRSPLSLDAFNLGPFWKKHLRSLRARKSNLLGSVSRKLRRIIRPYRLRQKRCIDSNDRRAAATVLGSLGFDLCPETFHRRSYPNASLRFPGLPRFRKRIEFTDGIGLREHRRFSGAPTNCPLLITVMDTESGAYGYCDHLSLEALTRMVEEINREGNSHE